MQHPDLIPTVISSDPVLELYKLAEALRHLAETLPEENEGLACLLRLLAEESRKHVAALDDWRRA